MNPTQKIKMLIPFIVLFALLGLLWRELFYAKPGELASVLVGESLPKFNLASLPPSYTPLTQNDFRGKVSLLNVWATWCYACKFEHPMLMKIKEQYHVPIYSINYKDNADEAQKWLDKKGNPYVRTGKDENGDVAIDLGVYGTPETFVINREGRIVYRHVGVIDQKTWDEVFIPLIKKLNGAI